MENLEKLEASLSKKLLKRRILAGALFLVFLSVGITFAALREASREVVVIGEGFFSYEMVTYRENYAIGIIIGFLTATPIGCYLLTDLLYCRFQTTVANGHSITVYRGVLSCRVYMDGKEADRVGFGSVSSVVDTCLPDGTKISVAFSRSVWTIAHVSFSDRNPSIDL